MWCLLTVILLYVTLNCPIDCRPLSGVFFGRRGEARLEDKTVSKRVRPSFGIHLFLFKTDPDEHESRFQVAAGGLGSDQQVTGINTAFCLSKDELLASDAKIWHSHLECARNEDQADTEQPRPLLCPGTPLPAPTPVLPVARTVNPTANSVLYLPHPLSPAEL